jgi:carboxyl-terminal processing protease
MKGVIIDLRDNPGGVLQPAVDLADGFLDQGVIVSTRGRNTSMQLEFSAQPGDWLSGIPMVVLIDRGSASASEVLAGALQDNGRALIIGETSFGKGSVQSVLPLRNGSGIKLTTARYYTPSGRSIQAEGIVPDLKLKPLRLIDESDRRLRESDLERHLEHEGPSDIPEVLEADVGANDWLDDDYYVREALSLLKGAKILSRATTPPPESGTLK